jgi:hypothetical protein
MMLAKKDIEYLFKIIWNKIYVEEKKEYKIENLKCMVKSWSIIYPKKQNIEDSLKKWLKEKYEIELVISEKSQNLFE